MESSPSHIFSQESGISMNVFKILNNHWKPLTPLILLHYGVVMSTGGILGGFINVMGYETGSVGFFIITNFGTIGVWSLSSTIVGATDHMMAGIYTGRRTPSILGSMRSALSHKWDIFTFRLLLLAVSTVASAISSIPLFYFSPATIVIRVVFIFIIPVSTVISSMNIGGVPSIVIEKKSAFDAALRSWDLCEPYSCYIFCYTCGFIFLTSIVTFLVNFIASELPVTIAFIIRLTCFALLLMLGPISSFVVYMTIRIQSEGLTQTQLEEELGGTDFASGDNAEEHFLNQESYYYQDIETELVQSEGVSLTQTQT